MILKSEVRKSMEENISEQLERYRKLAQISTDWFWETDENYTIIYMSDSVERITGFPKETYIGVSRYDLASEETKQTAQWQRHVNSVACHDPIKNFEYKHIGTNGYAVYLRVNAIPLFHTDDRFRGYLGSTTDISELVLARMRVEEVNYDLQVRTAELELAKAVAEAQARTDSLTGLNNRRAFFERSQAINDLARRYGQNYSVIMMDIDYFKNINDTYGHATGDIAIKSVAEIINKHARTSDILGRIGGEEFAIVLPQTLMQSAINMAERLRQAIAGNGIPLGKEILSFTASLGVAQFCSTSKSIDEVMSHADEALYRAKRQGRNRVVTSEI
jgi:diguanylate cyclase (GGDEF)-like protein/PAS domain S-box-containing protein